MEFIKANLNLIRLNRWREAWLLATKKVQSSPALRIVLETVLYLSFFAVASFGTPWILSKALNTKYPVASITSGSMWPVLKTGDLIFIKGVSDRQEVKLGDMVVYDNGQGFTVHRVVKKNEATITTKGDANNIEDNPVTYDRIIGKVITLNNNKTCKIPWLGNLSYLLKKGVN